MTPSQKPAGDDNIDIAALQRELEDLRAQVLRLTEIAGRAQADLQNAKTRMEKDGHELGRAALESVMKKLLPVFDHLQRASQHLPKELVGNEWAKGVLSIEQELLRIAKDMGLQKMEARGMPVDTAKHEVLTIGPGKEGEIIDVLEDGYELLGRVVRPAKVRVGDGSVQA